MVRRLVFFFVLNFSCLTLAISQQNIRSFYIGHSLSDGIAEMVKSLAEFHPQAELSFTYQSIPGSSLAYNWDAKKRNDYRSIPPFFYGFYDPNFGLPNGKFDVLVLTESVPRFSAVIQDSYQYADSFYRFATKFNSNIKIYLYEPWHCILSGTPNPCAWDVPSAPWRQRLTADLPMWESIVDTLNNRFKPKNSVCLIPAGQAFAALFDSIQLGKIPGITKLSDLFVDDIHLTDVGKYFISCVHFATLFNLSPVGLPNQLYSMWGAAFNPPSSAQAFKFQQIAWQIAKTYPKSCIKSSTDLDQTLEESEKIKLFPNPVSDHFQFMGSQNISHYQLFNSLGQLIFEGNDKSLNVSHLSPGVYFVKIGKQFIRLIKK
ncbi:MAG TPA: T9SS type A sorting domain-containing protein [Saprospiraceae bacterium]|nr:T9SS type A sorting domain-containing protein [Saprospiraceae bacterium]